MIKELEIDKNFILDFYNLVLGASWLVNEEVFFKKLTNKKALVYYKDDNLIGVLIYEKNSVFLIMVLPEYQRKGIGSELINYFSEDKKEIKIGSGCGEYLWPGVPIEMGSSISFFKKLGFNDYEKSYDLFINLEDLKTNLDLYKKMKEQNIEFIFANKNNIKSILEFEKENFPNWGPYFEREIKDKNYSNILIAQKEDEILASLLFNSDDYIWDKKIGNKVGGFGCLGTKENVRGRGVGLALAKHASEKLIERDVKVSLLGWTWLVDWYEKLGYKIWQEYKMIKKEMK